MRRDEPPEEKGERKAGEHADSDASEHGVQDSPHFTAPVQAFFRSGLHRPDVLFSVSGIPSGITRRPAARGRIPSGSPSPVLIQTLLHPVDLTPHLIRCIFCRLAHGLSDPAEIPGLHRLGNGLPYPSFYL